MISVKGNKSKTLIVLRGLVFVSFITIALATVVFQKNFFEVLRPTSYILLVLAIVSAIKSYKRRVN